MAQRDESFNEFLRNFKAKNEQKWANIVDATQDEQESALLAKSPEYRRNEMIMLEEFRRRKQMKDYFDLKKKYDKKVNPEIIDTIDPAKITDDREDQYVGAGPERYFENGPNEVFDGNKFTLIFLDSDSVTNVTSLNRVNQRRVLIFIGNGRGMISFGKGKAEDYENAFNMAFLKLKQNMVCLDWDSNFTVPTHLKGRHNDFYISIWPQHVPNYWGNPTIWKMLQCAGFNHCRYACKSRKRDPYALVYAFFTAVTQNTTTSHLETEEGRKLWQTSYGNQLTTKLRPMRNEDIWNTNQ